MATVSTKPTLSKVELRKLAINGYTYSGFWDGLYHYSKQINWPLFGYLEVKLTQKDIDDGSYKEMMDKDISRA